MSAIKSVLLCDVTLARGMSRFMSLVMHDHVPFEAGPAPVYILDWQNKDGTSLVKLRTGPGRAEGPVSATVWLD